ncbi:MAG: radical SAM family heme chaperone HemW [bacterium]
MIHHLYIHVPFCARLCPYCSFYKRQNDLQNIRVFLETLPLELEKVRAEFDIQPRTIYFGGGTPSILSLAQLEALFKDWPWREAEEFTFECNPATVSEEKARLLRSVGVNRISLGVQAFEPQHLQFLGRTHSREQVKATVARLRKAGFVNISLDLIFAFSGQSLAQWEAALKEAAALEPTHLSAYNLNVEEGSDFWKRDGVFQEVSEERQREMFFYTQDRLRELGFGSYEVSNFARPGWESLHNLACWRGSDYIGLGPSACSTVGERRWQNVAHMQCYADSVRRDGFAERKEEALSPRMKQAERIFLGLRTREGVEEGVMLPWKKEAEDLVKEGLAEMKHGRLRLTPRGLVLADSISEIFV